MWVTLALLLVVQTMDPPAEPGAIAPNATVTNGQVALTWIEGTKVRLARLEHDRWSKPITIAESDKLVANWADFPSLLRNGRQTLLHFPEGSGTEKYAYDVELALSKDGTRFARIGASHDDGTPTEHGFASILAERDGFRLFWLDGRMMAQDGPMQLRSALLRGGKVQPSEVLDERVCECCQTSAAITEAGPFIVYRDRSPEEIRNIAIVRKTTSGWSKPSLVHDDKWKMPGCPVNGPAADAKGKRAVVAWFTGADLGHVRIAFSNDSANSFVTHEVHDDPEASPLGRVDVVLVEDGAIVSYLVGDDEATARILYRHIGFEGARGPPHTVARTSPARASGFSRMVRSGDDLVFFWTQIGPPSSIRGQKIAVPSVARGHDTRKVATQKLGPNAPPYSARTLDGARVSLAERRGQVVLLNLWATWCGPCRRETPELIRLAKTHPSLKVIAVSVDEAENDERVRELVAREQLPFQVWRDPDDRVSQIFKVTALPATFLIDREGRIAFERYGAIQANDPELDAALIELGVKSSP